MSTPAILAIHKAIDSKRNSIRSLEDKLFLNPLSRIKSIPKKAKENIDPLEKAGFAI